jgi:hypothetical protein
MSLEYVVKPIDRWPGTRRHGSEQKRSPFGRMVSREYSPGNYYQSRERGATWSKIIGTLERELKKLRASGVIMRLDVRPDQIKIDGGVKSNASPATSAVMIEFLAEKFSPAIRLVYKCDVFRDWQSNVYAIAKSLEALRLVDRYEVTDAGQQYVGFKQIGATSSTTLSAQAAAEILAHESTMTGYAPSILADKALAKDMVRRALAKTHPDRNNGDRTAYDRVDAARSVLSSHHGVSL